MWTGGLSILGGNFLPSADKDLTRSRERRIAFIFKPKREKHPEKEDFHCKEKPKVAPDRRSPPLPHLPTSEYFSPQYVVLKGDALQKTQKKSRK